MNIKLDVKKFVEDYSNGVKDKDLLAKHHVNPKELIAIIKKLIFDGIITKEQYFGRNRKIEEEEARQEKTFLESLHHCIVCSHIQPTFFDICPSCGHSQNNKQSEESSSGEPLSEVPATAREESPQKTEPEDIQKWTKSAPEETLHFPQMSVPDELMRRVGLPLEEIRILPELQQLSPQCEYLIADIINSGFKATVYRALDDAGLGPELAVKCFHPDLVPGKTEELLTRILTYQAGMVDPNIIPVLGAAELESQPVLLYQIFRRNLDQIVTDYPDGVPLDLVFKWLPQMLNGLGYSHMHRARDGEVRRLAHLNIKLSKFLVSDDLDHIHLDDCGVARSIIELRGHKHFLYEESGADLRGMAPEAFVIESKSLNGFALDIYALGAALYRLVTGKAPFIASELKEYSFAHLRTFPIPPKVHRYTVPGWLDSMILKCLQKEPQKRWRSATQMELAIGKDISD